MQKCKCECMILAQNSFNVSVILYEKRTLTFWKNSSLPSPYRLVLSLMPVSFVSHLPVSSVLLVLRWAIGASVISGFHFGELYVVCNCCFLNDI